MQIYFNFIHETVNSHNLVADNLIAHVIFVLLDQSKPTYYPNYLIKPGEKPKQMFGRIREQIGENRRRRL